MKSAIILSIPLLSTVASADRRPESNASHGENAQHVGLASIKLNGSDRAHNNLLSERKLLRQRRDQYSGLDFIVDLLGSNDVPVATEPSQSANNTPNPTWKPTLDPTLRPMPDPTPNPSPSPTDSVAATVQTSTSFFESRMGCASGQKKVKMDILVDRYGAETSWTLDRLNSDGTRYTAMSSRTYTENESEVQEMCLDVGKYELVIMDGIGDGICCQYDEGYYKFSLESDGSWDTVITGGNFKSTRFVHQIEIRVTDPPRSERDEQWLIAHNTRREYWHNFYNKSYVPLKWSAELAESSRVYAEKLLDACDSGGIVHDPDNLYGENMAKNKGTGGWGEEYLPDKLVGRFIDREVGLPWPDNAHLTQALWRASVSNVSSILSNNV